MIQQIRAAAMIPLESWGKVGLPLTEPACELRGTTRVITQREDTEAGIWECSPGKFRREIVAGEMMHFIAGRCTFTPDDGQVVEIAAGDTLFFPPRTTGVWHVLETVRKVYVLL